MTTRTAADAPWTGVGVGVRGGVGVAGSDAGAVLARQTAVMQLIADGAPLGSVLDAVVLALEDLMPSTRSSVLLLEPGARHLRHGAAPSLPVRYAEAIDGLEIGPTAGSCGTAAHTGAEVIAEDVRTDPRWEAFRHLAEPHGLRSCWSVPIRGREGVAGTFAVYHGEPHRPDLRERGLVEHFAHLASVAIDHHRLYRALTDSEERFRRAFDDNAVGMALTELDGRVVRANAALLDLLGLAEADVVGRDVAQLISVSHEETDGPAAGPGAAAGAQFSATALRGSAVLRLSVTTSRLLDAQGRPTRLCLTVLDVTQRWEAARERRAREAAEYARRAADEDRRAAERASRAKSAFVAGLGHELRTPLQAIVAFTELLADVDLSADRRRAALGHITGATGHILGLVDEVLDLARVEAGALAIHPAVLRVDDVVDEVLDLLRVLAAERGVGLTRDAAALAVRADPLRLRQVLLNVVGNAIRYNHRGGTVHVGIVAGPDAVDLRVRDSGPGIAADLLERLFVPFDRLGADDGPERGVGLGLVLSRGLAEAMGGTLDVDSVAGRGTTVRIRMPRAPVSPAPAPGP